jgi:transcription factor TFIIIB component B''
MAIAIYGTDFALASSLFGPSKTREQIKNKFKKEEKKNKEAIDIALKNP